MRKGHQLLKMQNHLDNHVSSDDIVAALVTASVTKLQTVCSHSFQLTVSSVSWTNNIFTVGTIPSLLILKISA